MVEQAGRCMVAPAHEGVSAEATGATAGRVHHHHVGREWRPHSDLDLRPPGALFKTPQRIAPHIVGSHPGTAGSQRQALASGPCAEVEHPGALTHGNVLTEALAGGVLHLEPAVAEAAELGHLGAAHEMQGVGQAGGRLALHPLLQQPLPQLISGTQREVGPHGDRRPTSEAGAQGGGFGGAEGGEPLPGQLDGQRECRREVSVGLRGLELVEAVALEDGDHPGDQGLVVVCSRAPEQRLVPGHAVDEGLNSRAVLRAEAPLLPEPAGHARRRM